MSETIILEAFSDDLKKEVDLEDVMCHGLGMRVKDVVSKDDGSLYSKEGLTLKNCIIP